MPNDSESNQEAPRLPASLKSFTQILSSVQPPIASKALADIYGADDLYARFMKDILRKYGLYDKLPIRPIYDNDDQLKLPPGVLRTLAVRELSKRFSVSSGRWDSSVGIPDTKIYFDSTEIFHSRGWGAKEVNDDATDVMDKVSAKYILQAWAESEHMFLPILVSIKSVIYGLAQNPYHLKAHKAVLVLLDVVLEVTAGIVHELKFVTQVPRPHELDAQGRSPLLPVPAYSSYPGGHAAAIHAIAETIIGLTSRINPPQEVALRDLAGAIANRRIEIGFHTTIDTTDGTAIGKAIATALLSGLKGAPVTQALIQAAALEAT